MITVFDMASGEQDIAWQEPAEQAQPQHEAPRREVALRLLTVDEALREERARLG
ncbi:hypothetical protein [Chitinimonas koreensis]|uniref:hypothetical protein n=1 Tax=Chitinimonas koreensis TaxID=356302 RepID=UPI0003F6D852|nr:hypothetical protein [Chitinimonas koreensis]QNM95202.1 hypothetical protein H9L41_15120 [Chitinimonas koreensis]